MACRGRGGSSARGWLQAFRVAGRSTTTRIPRVTKSHLVVFSDGCNAGDALLRVVVCTQDVAMDGSARRLCQMMRFERRQSETREAVS